jgi:hypothetical protein
MVMLVTGLVRESPILFEHTRKMRTQPDSPPGGGPTDSTDHQTGMRPRQADYAQPLKRTASATRLIATQ